jgi:hypothetical protein
MGAFIMQAAAMPRVGCAQLGDPASIANPSPNMEDLPMRKTLLLCAALLAGSALPIAARAGCCNFDSYVSAGGSDSASCAITAPCATMAHAISQTDGGGIVHCLDSGDYSVDSRVTIAETLTIDCAQTNSRLPPFIVNQSGATVFIHGGNFQYDGYAGIDFQNGTALIVDGVEFSQNFTAIYFEPSANAQLRVSNSLIFDNSNGVLPPSGGIYHEPGSAVTADVAIDSTRVESNSYGIVADGSGGGIVSGTVSNSVVSGSLYNGITVNSPSSSVVLLVDETKVSGNTHGLVAGDSAGMLVRNTSVVGNLTAGLYTTGGGTLYSYGNNSVNGNNGHDGSFTGTVGLK